MALRVEAGTISGLARRLDVRKGSIAHHLRVLVDSGMVRAAETRQTRGGTEQYYEIAVGPISGSGRDITSALLSAVTSALLAADDPLLHLRHVRLTRDQAARLGAALEAIIADAPSTHGAPAYGVLVGLYPISP